MPTNRQASAFPHGCPFNPQPEMFTRHLVGFSRFLFLLLCLSVVVRASHSRQPTCFPQYLHAIPHGLNKFVYPPLPQQHRDFKLRRKSGSLGSPNAMSFWNQPNPLFSLWLDGEGRLQQGYLWKTSLDSVGYYLTLGEESTWRKSLFV